MKKLFSMLISVIITLSISITSCALEMPGKYNVPLDKAWIVEFNMQTDIYTVNKDTVYITNSDSSLIDCHLSTGSNTSKIIVTPADNYKSNETYTLHVTEDLKSKNGKYNLSEAVTMDFTTVDTLKVYFFDVGQGDSIYIKAPAGDDILIDTGDDEHGDIVVDYLNRLNVDDIEFLIVTHPCSDRIDGLNNVLANFDVESVYAAEISYTTQSYADFLATVQNEGIIVKKAGEGVSLPLDGIEAVFLDPVEVYGPDSNDCSAVLRLDYHENSFLFMGDDAAESEVDILKKYLELNVDVLAIISRGHDNAYAHPDINTLTRLALHSLGIYRTDMRGTIAAICDGDSIIWNTDL